MLRGKTVSSARLAFHIINTVSALLVIVLIVVPEIGLTDHSSGTGVLYLATVIASCVWLGKSLKTFTKETNSEHLGGGK